MERYFRIGLSLVLFLFVGVLVYRFASQHYFGEQPEDIPGEARLIGWQDLLGLDYRSGEADGFLKELHDQMVRIPGYAVPLEDSMSRVQTFLLVPNGMACIHVPPPPPNQIIQVTLASPLSNRKLMGPLWTDKGAMNKASVLFFLPLNVISEMSKVVSISFRLFGNIIGGSIIIVVVSTLVYNTAFPIGLDLFFIFFVGTVQAFVFTMLTLTYIAVAIK